MSYSKALTYKILADILNQQDIPDHDADISPQRLYQALSTGPAFDDTEARILWASPLVREDYREIRNQIQAEVRQRCRQQGLVLSIPATEAAFAPAQSYSLSAGSFQVDLLHTGDPEEPWLVQLRLGESLQAVLGDWHQLHLRLVDAGGLEWLCQRYDGETVLLQDWSHPEIAADARMGAYAVSLLIE